MIVVNVIFIFFLDDFSFERDFSYIQRTWCDDRVIS